MKKIVLCGLLLALCTGCGRGWMPRRGGFCGSKCGPSLPPPPAADPCGPCASVPTSTSYGSYDGTIVDGEYYGGEVVGEYYNGVITNGGGMGNAPSMVPTEPAN